MYRLIKPILFFLFPPEQAHHLIKNTLKFLRYVPFAGLIIRCIFSVSRKSEKKLEREVFGIKFRNPVGLAAGFDKNGDMYNDLANFGFGFIEIGSLTPEPQSGNPKPRLFRLPKDSAIINRMGINNNGVRFAVDQIKKRHPNVILAGNISKNSTTSNEDAANDYEKSFAFLYDFVDFFVINVSCPNVKDLCKLQDVNSLSEIIDRVVMLRKYYDEYRPILLKISPDLSQNAIDEAIELVQITGLDGIVATNTTQDRSTLTTDRPTVEAIGNGGLSGAPLYKRSLELVKYISRKTEGQVPIIAVGGIMTPEQAKEMLDSGASLVEIYSGFIYNGPSFVKKILKHLIKSECSNDNRH